MNDPQPIPHQGFYWGPMTVTRFAELSTSYVLKVHTDARIEIDIYVSKAGRNIRVYGRSPHKKRGEWTPCNISHKACPTCGQPSELDGIL
jgi:hypothetical protein